MVAADDAYVMQPFVRRSASPVGVGNMFLELDDESMGLWDNPYWLWDGV
jgi:hypothetical protein